MSGPAHAPDAAVTGADMPERRTTRPDCPFPPAWCRNGHEGTVREIGWGEPPTLHPSCSCGWTGTTRDTWGDALAAMTAAYRELAEHVGYDATAHRRALDEAIGVMRAADGPEAATEAARLVVTLADELAATTP